MSLRVRLIVAFFLLSVVPLAAVTFYSYVSNERALQVAAQHETEMLTSELTQRMQVVTTQISERVEHLMDMPVSSATATGTTGTKPAPKSVVARATPPPAAPRPPAPATPAAPAAPAPAAVTAALNDKAMEAQVAASLGEVAMLLNNVEVRGLGRGGRNGAGQGPPPSAAAASRAFATGLAAANAALRAEAQSSASGRGEAQGRGESQARGESQGRGEAQGRDGGPGRGGPGRFRPGPPPGAQPGGPPMRGQLPEMPDVDPTHMRIDLAPIRRDIFRELAPNANFDQMTPEERARIGREVNQRLLGIVQGFQLSAAEIQKKAEAAEKDTKERVSKERATVPAVPAAPKAPFAFKGRRALPSRTVVAPVAPAPSAPAPAALPPSAVAAAAPAPPPTPKPMTRKSALSGTKLNVRFESNGQVVQQVNAEINLPNLLATVFSNTRRDSGEIPFAVGKDGHLYTPTDADKAKLATLDVSRIDDTIGTKRVGNWIVVTMPDKTGAGLRFGIARPVGNLLNDLRRTTARNASFGLLFIGIALIGIVPLSGRLTRNLSVLTEGVGRIAQGDYRARVPVKSGDEIGRLASAFNQMAADVEQHQRAAIEQERIRRELELGRRIQSEMLPHAPLHLGLTEIKGVSVPAREVGGDFFNYFQLDSGQLALLVGDVSGKGVGAALTMANIQASLRTRFALGQELSAIAEAIDRDIGENTPGPVYATLFIAVFNPATHRLRYVNAGHNPQFVLRNGGQLEKMTSTGLPVGMLAGHGYREMEVQLAAGDLLFFYTDGCVEMENESGEMFGSDRLESLVASAAGGTADGVLVTVETAIAAFRGVRDQFDDATMMAVTIG